MIAENLDRIRHRAVQACARCGRDPAEVTLVVVAKTFGAGVVREVLQAGAADIGENYVQELLGKHEELSDLRVRWHFIGHLQRNKVKQVLPVVDLIHAVESRDLARELDSRAKALGRKARFLVEVNTTGEQSKFGLKSDSVAEFVRDLEGLEHIAIDGLMTIGPFLPDPEGSRPMFRQLRILRDELRSIGQPNAPMNFLSMGMTGDFEVGIEEGATHIRIGTAIFGSRKKPA
jgi:pyridoxal phosphate enzyme (YggS family)